MRRVGTGAPTSAPVATAAVVGAGFTGAAIVSLVTGVAVGAILGNAFNAVREAVGIRYPWELGKK